MKYLILLALLASCGSDLEDQQVHDTRDLTLQCVSNNNGTTCYGEGIKCSQPYWHNGAMTCTVTVKYVTKVEE